MENIKLSEANKKYKYADILEGCEEAIEKNMKPPSGVYYRLVHDPLHPNDDLPQPLQQWDALTEGKTELSHQLPKDSSIKDQWDHVQTYSPSYNESDEKLAAYFLKEYDRRKTIKQKEKFLNKKGDTIVAVKLTPNDGLISDIEENGHCVFLPFEGFKLEDHIDESWGSQKLMNYRNEENK